uniref:Axin interactor, dorsalization associated n=1 Tax=Poecilia reticulata TaxID=8081 RepID=A0A3P9NS39_POERE
MSDVNKTVQKWHASFKKGTDFDSWGQLVEHVCPVCPQWFKSRKQRCFLLFCSKKKNKNLGKIATCLEMRSASLQCTQSKEEFKLEDLKKLELIIKNILTYNKEFPFDVQPVPLRKILAPGEEENLELEAEDDAAAGAGSTETFPPRAPGTLWPRLPSEPGMTLLTLRIEKIGLKDAGQCIDPGAIMIQIMIKKKNTIYCFFFYVTLWLRSQLTGKASHYKPKKRFTSTKCFAFMEMDEIKPGPIVIELYKKPTDFKRKKLQLLTKKPLYLHLNQTLHKDS